MHAAKADRRMPHSLNDRQIQTTITWHSKRLLLTTGPLLRDGKISIYASQGYNKLHFTVVAKLPDLRMEERLRVTLFDTNLCPFLKVRASFNRLS